MNDTTPRESGFAPNTGPNAPPPADDTPPLISISDPHRDPITTLQDSDKKSADSPSASPPTSYDIALPDGMSEDPDMMAAFKEVAAKHDLSQDTAQAMMDLYGHTVARMDQEQQQIVQQWAADTRADAELGGARFDAVIGTANAGLKAYGSPALVDLLAQSGLGNHPEVIRAFYKVGKTLSEEGRPAGSAPLARDPLAALYPTMFAQE